MNLIIDDKFTYYRNKINKFSEQFRKTGQLDTVALAHLRERFHKHGYFELHGYCFYLQAMTDVDNGDFENIQAHIETLRTKKYAFIPASDGKKVRITDSYSFIYKHLLTAIYSHYKEQDYEKTTSYLKKAEKLIKKIKQPDNYTKFVILHVSGLLLNAQRKYEQARDYLLKSLKVDLGEENEVARIGSYALLGGIEENFGNILGAIKYLKICEDYYHKEKYQMYYAEVCNSLGLLYLYSGMYSIALSYFNKSLKIVEKRANNTSNNIPQTVLKGNIGMTYLRSLEMDKAEKYLNEALQESLKLNHIRIIAGNRLDLAELYFLTGRLDLTKEHAQAVVDLLQDIKIYEDDLVNAYTKLARICIIENDLPTAAKYIRKANKLSVKTDSKKLKQRIMDCYVEYYKAMNQYKKTLAYKEKSNELGQEINKEKWDMANKIIEFVILHQGK